MKKIIICLLLASVSFGAMATKNETSVTDNNPATELIQKYPGANIVTEEGDFGCTVTITIYDPALLGWITVTEHSALLGRLGCIVALNRAIESMNKLLDQLSYE